MLNNRIKKQVIIVIRKAISLFVFLSFFIATYSYCGPISVIKKVAEISKAVEALKVTAMASKVLTGTSIAATVLNTTSKMADMEDQFDSKSMALNDYCQSRAEDTMIRKTKVISIYLKPNKTTIRGISKLRCAFYKLPELEYYQK